MRLDGLIRLHRWRVEERRRELAEAERREAQLRAQLKALEAELAAERALAEAASVSGGDYAAYAASVRQRQNALSAPLDEVARLRQQAEEALAAAFRELKTYELAEGNRLARARQAAARREQSVLDEVARNMLRRGERGG